MLKRIADWTLRVGVLHEEIMEVMPAQYKNPKPEEWELVSNPNPDEKDFVACQWTACDKSAADFCRELLFLDFAIKRRTGVTLPEKCFAPEPEESHKPKAATKAKRNRHTKPGS